MKHCSTFRIYLISFVLAILTISCIISGVIVLILSVINFSPKLIARTLFFAFTPVITSVIFGMFLSTLLGNRFLTPIHDLIAAMRKVANGDFNTEVPIDLKSINPHGEIYELLDSFNNMTKELASIEIFRNDFINEFSHEFKTPIVSIQGFAKQLQKGSLSYEQQKEYIDIIVDESQRLTNMSSNILLLSKYESQNIISDKTNFYLDEQLRKVILLLEKQWSEKNLTLDIDLEEMMFNGNEEMISQIWINLLSNAIKFNSKNGYLSVKGHRMIDCVSITISDTGIGMDEETKKNIFNKFYQGDTSHTSKGNGLGLSLVKRICILCNGTISVKSKLGEGSSFNVKLPIDV